MWLLLLIISISVADEEFYCDRQYKQACCHSKCPFCGPCLGKNGQNTTTVIFGEFFDNCCTEAIMSDNITCVAGGSAPCVLPDTYFSDIDRIREFFESGPVYLIVIVSIILFIVAMFLIYVFFIFGDKKPPMRYSEIRNTLPPI